MYAVTVVFQELNTLDSNKFLEISTSVSEALLTRFTFMQRASELLQLGLP